MATKVSDVWAEGLSEALEKWCKRNGYSPRTTLCQELDIPKEAWGRISSGANVVTDIELYARLFLKTRLSESDPRTVPARPRGNIADKLRAWSTKEYQDWLDSLDENPPGWYKRMHGDEYAVVQNHKTNEKVEEMATVRPIQKDSPSLGFFDTLIESMIEKAAERGAQKALQEMSRNSASSKDVIGSMINKLYNEAFKKLNGTVEERDELYDNHGTAMLRLINQLLLLTRQPSEERERYIQLDEEIN